MDGKTFWERAKPLIRAQNMTYKQYAEYLGISVNTLYGWIKHERVPELSMAYTIAVTLGVTLDYLFGGKERNIADARLKELAARRAAAKVLKMAEQIVRELKEIKPL